jgi:Xaa-Pro aminopeptidase
MASNYTHRVASLQSALTDKQAILLSTPTDITYVSGFEFLVPEEREAFFCITKDTSFLIRATFCPVPEPHSFQVLNNCRPDALALHLLEIVKRTSISEVLYDASSLHVDEFQLLTDQLRPVHCSLSKIDKNMIWERRQIKDATELTALREAGKIAELAFQKIKKFIAIGMTEQEIAEELNTLLRKLGAEGTAFPTIVAFGPHAAIPHHQPTPSTLQNNTVILIDFGARFQGYRSDMTRTFWFGDTPSQTFTEVEKVVQSAYKAAVDSLTTAIKEKTLLTAEELDKSARNIIAEAGYAEKFIHTTGHGVGLDIHEPPSLHPRNNSQLAVGMVITIEPGIYLEGQLGYRHENTFVILDKKLEQLTQA